MNSRHGFKENDINFLEFLNSNKIFYQIVFTKTDKISKKREEALMNGLKFHELIKKKVSFFYKLQNKTRNKKT